MFRWREREAGEGYYHGVDWAVTDRWGGASLGPYRELNLGGRVGDTPEAVETNRHRLAHALGLPLSDLRFMRQVHSAVVALASEAEREPVECDGIVTDRTDIALVVLVADCTPVLLADRTTGVVGAAHAGRVGMMNGVVPATVRRMRVLGAEEIEAVVGPSICARCYEVPAEMRDEAAAVTPVAAAVSWTGTPAIDVAGAVVAQLHAEGVRVRWLPGCSRESQDLYSHRREAPTGRYAGVVRSLPPEGAA